MPTYTIYATGSYTYTRTITADTKEDAEAEFYDNKPEICLQCESEGIELGELSSQPYVSDGVTIKSLKD